jgi:hypothetical protein
MQYQEERNDKVKMAQPHECDGSFNTPEHLNFDSNGNVWCNGTVCLISTSLLGSVCIEVAAGSTSFRCVPNLDFFLIWVSEGSKGI